MRSPLVYGTALAIAGALSLWGCSGGGGSTPASPSAPTPRTITVAIVGAIGNAAYKPNPVSASAGDTVMFKNDDSRMHRIVLDDGSADLGDVMPGATSRGVTLRNTNATNFHCTVHPSMVGSINSASAPEPRPCPDPYGYGC